MLSFVTRLPVTHRQGDPDHFQADASANPAEAGDNQTTTPIVLAPGDVFLSMTLVTSRMMLITINSIGDTVWFDKNANGTLDGGEVRHSKRLSGIGRRSQRKRRGRFSEIIA